jgi:hypothetical protein
MFMTLAQFPWVYKAFQVPWSIRHDPRFDFPLICRLTNKMRPLRKEILSGFWGRRQLVKAVIAKQLANASIVGFAAFIGAFLRNSFYEVQPNGLPLFKSMKNVSRWGEFNWACAFGKINTFEYVAFYIQDDVI